MTPQLERLTELCKQLNLLHLPTQIAHLGQMAAKRELGYLDFLEQALKDEAMARAERMRRMLTRLAGFPARRLMNSTSNSRSACRKRWSSNSAVLPLWSVPRMSCSLDPVALVKPILLSRLDIAQRRPGFAPASSLPPIC